MLAEAEKQNRMTIELQSRISILTKEKETLVMEGQRNNEGLRSSVSTLKLENDNLKQSLTELARLQEKLNSAVR